MTPSQRAIFLKVQKHLEKANSLMAKLNEGLHGEGCPHEDQEEITLMGDKVRKFTCKNPSCQAVIETTTLVGPTEPVRATETWPPRSFR